MSDESDRLNKAAPPGSAPPLSSAPASSRGSAAPASAPISVPPTTDDIDDDWAAEPAPALQAEQPVTQQPVTQQPGSQAGAEPLMPLSTTQEPALLARAEHAAPPAQETVSSTELQELKPQLTAQTRISSLPRVSASRRPTLIGIAAPTMLPSPPVAPSAGPGPADHDGAPAAVTPDLGAARSPTASPLTLGDAPLAVLSQVDTPRLGSPFAPPAQVQGSAGGRPAIAAPNPKLPTSFAPTASDPEPRLVKPRQRPWPWVLAMAAALLFASYPLVFPEAKDTEVVPASGETAELARRAVEPAIKALKPGIAATAPAPQTEPTNEPPNAGVNAGRESAKSVGLPAARSNVDDKAGDNVAKDSKAKDGKRSVVISTRPPGARFFHKGRPAGTSPLTVELAPGEKRAFEVALPGYMTRKVVADGKKPELTVGLLPNKAAKRGQEPRPTR